MEDVPSTPLHLAGSGPRQGQSSPPQPPPRGVQDHPSERGNVQFVMEPEELDPYEDIPSPLQLPGAPVDSRQHEAYRPLHPRYSVPGPRYQDPEITTPSWERRPYRRSTTDSSESNRSQLGGGPGRVRFTEPERRPKPPYRGPTEDDWLPSSLEGMSDRRYRSIPTSYRSRSRSRSRPVHRPQIIRGPYGGDLDDDVDGYSEDGFDELIGGRVFQFVPSRNSGALSNKGYSVDTDASSEKPDDGISNANDGQSISRAGKILHVFESRYTGDAVPDGIHTTELTVVHDPKKQRQPLFRWMHLEQPMMNLEELSAEVSQIPAITDSERNGFARLLSGVKKSCVKSRPTSKGSSARHMDPRQICMMIPPDGRSKNQAPNSFTWLCIPYFSLEKYSGLLSASTASSFPIETLLQSEYSRTTREREMQQVVCQNGEAPSGTCFHIAQLWCIVLNNSLLITCGRMSASTLRSDLVRVVTVPPKEPQGRWKTIYVKYSDAVLWAFPLEACSTWFDFIMHFREFWPRPVKIYHRDHILVASDWPRIANLVKTVNSKVTLELRLCPYPRPPAAGILRSLERDAEVPENQKPNDNEPRTRDPGPGFVLDDSFHVFSWLEMAQAESNNRKLDTEALVAHLREAEEFLLSSIPKRDRNAYRTCDPSSQRLVYMCLREEEPSFDDMEEETREKSEYEGKVEIYNAADIIHSFFLPRSSSKHIPTVGKFWGAIRGLVEVSNSDADYADDIRSQRSRLSRRVITMRRDVFLLGQHLRYIARETQYFQDIMLHASDAIRSRAEIPDSLVRAWLHLVMGLVQASLADEAWTENLNIAGALIRRGMDDIMNGLSSENLLYSSVVQPMDLVSLVSFSLLRDSTERYSSINDTYSDYLKGLENEITANNSDRSHQFRLALFKQEVVVIQRVVSAQLAMVEGMSLPSRSGYRYQTWWDKEILEREMGKPKVDATVTRSYERQGAVYVDGRNAHESHNLQYRRSASENKVISYAANHNVAPLWNVESFSRLSSTDRGGFRELLSRECRALLERRDFEFNELQRKASGLEEMNANMIEFRKDRQEAAVYAFTMVTIIFLPLSTISSIFGMNSSDLRDMELGQWAYWAVALPTTVAVIVTGLWWMGELHNIVSWVGRLLLYRQPRNFTGGGYYAEAGGSANERAAPRRARHL
ncbi:hypothetical protein GGS23DRAFT_301604 [Durotheca rogersii]|uniref:uncharacterized protein n=1 Tax=Durotheca rogersii TaxID=419775 RepID=UPI00221EF08A|nr:uncharacterized protein GGS23DRAFT_301604 [Durotheca rogersii]KAI5867033.1 hypothetical protein GGS23DRAFT_301604 [Durotheca rogersii]